jgi:hypothetical protein
MVFPTGGGEGGVGRGERVGDEPAPALAGEGEGKRSRVGRGGAAPWLCAIRHRGRQLAPP